MKRPTTRTAHEPAKPLRNATLNAVGMPPRTLGAYENGDHDPHPPRTWGHLQDSDGATAEDGKDGCAGPPGGKGPGTQPEAQSSPPTVPAPPPPSGEAQPAELPPPLDDGRPSPPSRVARAFGLRARGVLAVDLPAELRGRWAAIQARAPRRHLASAARMRAAAALANVGWGNVQPVRFARRAVQGPTAAAYQAAISGRGERGGVLALWVLARALGYGWRLAAHWARQRLGRLPVAVVASWAEGLWPARARAVVLSWCGARERAPGTMGLLPAASSRRGWTWELGGERWRFADVVSWPLPAGLEAALCGCAGCDADGREVHGGRAWARYVAELRDARRAARRDEREGGHAGGRAEEGSTWGEGGCVRCGRLVLPGARVCGGCEL